MAGARSGQSINRLITDELFDRMLASMAAAQTSTAEVLGPARPTSNRPYVCPLEGCGYDTNSKTQVVKHLDGDHQITIDRSRTRQLQGYKCNVCGFGASHRPGLYDHYRKVPGRVQGQVGWVCPSQ